MSRDRRAEAAGFTLIEVVAAMTVMALVVVVLYYSFSTALTTWQKQDADNEQAERTVAMARLLTADLRACRPYTLNWKEGKDFFFAAGESAVFYVTTSGFGAALAGYQPSWFILLKMSVWFCTQPSKLDVNTLFNCWQDASGMNEEYALMRYFS